MFEEGDFYLLNDGRIFKNVGARWILQCNIRGPQGLRGPQGTAVTANPLEEATDEITKIKVDGIVYSLRAISTEEKQMLINLLEYAEWDESGNFTLGHNLTVDGITRTAELDTEYIDTDDLEVQDKSIFRGEVDASSSSRIIVPGWEKLESDNEGEPLSDSLFRKEDKQNRVQTLENAETTTYPSTRAVSDAITEVREVAAGKKKAYIISINQPAITEDNVTQYKKSDGTNFESYEQFQDYVGDETMANGLFDSTANIISWVGIGAQDLRNKYLVTHNKIVYRYDDETGNRYGLKNGDDIYIIETNIPDRWVGTVGCYILETKTGASGVAYLNEVNTFTDENYFNAAVMFNHDVYALQPSVIQFTNTDKSLQDELDAKANASDLTTVAKTDVANKFTAEQTFTNITVNKKISSATDIDFYQGVSRRYVLSPNGFKPEQNGQRDLGFSNQQWRNLYLSGIISDATNSVTVAQIASAIAQIPQPPTDEGSYVLKCHVISGNPVYAWELE